MNAKIKLNEMFEINKASVLLILEEHGILQDVDDLSDINNISDILINYLEDEIWDNISKFENVELSSVPKFIYNNIKKFL